MADIKVMSIFGTRPEAIKMAPLVRELEKREGIEHVTAVTGQHREMLAQVLELFGIEPAYNLAIMRPRQTARTITTDILEKLEPVLAAEKPDLVLVHGDTTTAFASALAAFYQKIPVGHVEAGLRTYDRYLPFPEEMNRRLIGPIAALHFSPTAACVENLHSERITEGIYVTGNTAIDALRMTVQPGHVFKSEELKTIDFSRRMLFFEAHRGENIGAPMESICRAVRRLLAANPDVELLWPMHLNPAVRTTAHAFFDGAERVHLIEPLDPADAQNAMALCELILTDSGGIQEEAPSLGKPVVVLRGETERPEAVAHGNAVLVGTDEEKIFGRANLLLNDRAAYDKMAEAANPYGDGQASRRIADAILHHFGKGPRPEEFRV